MNTPLLCQIAEVSFGVPVIAGAYLYRTLGTQGRRFFFYCLLMALGISVEAIIPMTGRSNYFFIRVFVIGQTIGIAGMFCSFVKNGRWCRFVLILLMVFLAISAGHDVFTDTQEALNEVDILFSGVIQILLGGILVYVAINVQEVPYQKNPLFLFGFSILIYNAGTVMILSFGNVLLKMGLEYFTMAWTINWSLAIFSNILCAYTFFFLRDE